MHLNITRRTHPKKIANVAPRLKTQQIELQEERVE